MRILLVNNEKYTEPFIRYITKMVRQQVLLNYKPNKFQKFQEIFEQMGITTPVDIAVRAGINAIHYVEVDNKKEKGFEILIDDKAQLSGTKYKVIDIVNLFENGNTEVSGEPIFGDAFKYVEDNLSNYYRLYSIGLGVIYEYLPL